MFSYEWWFVGNVITCTKRLTLLLWMIWTEIVIASWCPELTIVIISVLNFTIYGWFGNHLSEWSISVMGFMHSGARAMLTNLLLLFLYSNLFWLFVVSFSFMCYDFENFHYFEIWCFIFLICYILGFWFMQVTWSPAWSSWSYWNIYFNDFVF